MSEIRHTDGDSKYRLLFDAIDQGVCICEVIVDEERRPIDYRFVNVNEAFERETGLRNAVGKTARELVPNLEQHWIDVYGEVALNRRPVRFEQGSNAMGRWFDVYAFPFGETGDLTFGILFKDITDRKAVNDRFRAIFDGLGVSVWEEDFSEVKRAVDGVRASGVTDFRSWLNEHPEFVERAIAAVRIVDVNPASLRFFKAASREQLLQSLGTIFLPETRAVFVEELVAMAEGQRVYESETRLQTVTGEPRHVLFSIAFPAPDQPFTRVIVTLSDITDRKRAEETVRASEMRFREMADNAPVMIWVTEVDGRCTFLSKSWYEFTGQTPATGLGFGWLEAVHPDDRERSGAVFHEANQREAPFRIDYRLRRADGEYRWAIDSAAPRLGPSGEYLGYIGSVIDIADRKNAEEALRRSAEALREADRLKDEFLATLSHELRTPLTSILGWGQMITGGHIRSDEVIAGVEAITRSARVQLALIEDVLDISRITTGKMRLDRRRVPLSGVIDAAVETVRPAAEAKRIKLRRDDDPAVGVVSIDPDRMQQVVWNLLSNAIKFTPAGGQVSVTTRRDEGDIVIEVADNGIGISRSFLPHLFQRFRQADSSSRRAHSGLGVGLALTKDLVELHGGTIVAESEDGKGARFTITIPAAVRAGVMPERAEVSPTLYRVRVLLVDDDQESRKMFSTMLRTSGAQVAAASSVDEALRLLDDFAADVIVTDLAMPERDGYDLAAAVRTNGLTIPVVALTAQDEDLIKDRVATAGFARVLHKPIEIDELVGAMSEVAARA